LIWFKFVLCLAIILFAGTKLARYGDAIAEKTGLGRLWIGLVLLAAITSIPELVTGVSAAAVVRLPDLALGTLFGSCSLNLAILALLDIFHQRTPVLTEASPGHVISAGWGILLIGIAAGAIFAGERVSGLALGWLGILSIVIFIVYLLGMWWMFRYERGRQLLVAPASSLKYEEFTTRTVYIRFALAAAAVIAAGIWLSFIGDEIGETTGWSATFVGSLFLAITTSMPELVVTMSALRLGAIDMAVADILGSNMFNIAIIAPVDLSYAQGPILSLASSSHLITAAVVVLMSLLVIAGLRFRQRRKVFGVLSWYAPVLIVIYVFGAYALFGSSAGL
jgi:cation:H+ antiporter